MFHRSERSAPYASMLLPDLSPQRLDFSPAGLGVDALFLRRLRRPGRYSLFARPAGAFDQRLETRKRLAPVLFLAAVTLRLDDDDALFGDAPVLEREQPFLVAIGQRGGLNVEAEMYRRGDLVDVLAAGALGPDGGELNVGYGDGNVTVNPERARPARRGRRWVQRLQPLTSMARPTTAAAAPPIR